MPALIASRRSTRVCHFRLEAYIARSGFSGVCCPGTILTRWRTSQEGVLSAYRTVARQGLERVRPGLAGGAEITGPGAGEKGEKGTEVAACGALAANGEGGVQVGKG